MDWKTSFSAFPIASTDTLPPLAISLLDNWGAITMVGDDKKSYLQGQVTCDVVSLEQEASTLGAHCDAKGKVWAVFRLFHHRDGYALLQDKSALDVELKEIKKYAVFSKVTIEESSEVVLGISGDNTQQWVDALTPEQQGDVRQFEHGTLVKISSTRWQALVTETFAEQLTQHDEVLLTDHQLWDLQDIRDGLPRLPHEEQNQRIPQALNLQALNAISFRKGCYTGQEIVARAKYRGTNKRALFILEGDVEQDLTLPVTLERSVGDNWRDAGSLLNIARYSDNKAIGLAVLPNNLDDDVTIRLAEHPNCIWTFKDLPYSLEEE